MSLSKRLREAAEDTPDFETVSQLLEEAADALEAQGEWVSVEDRLPEVDQYVIIHPSPMHNDPPIGWRERIEGKWMSVEFSEAGLPFYCDNVTHWRLLPTPPTEDA